MQSEPGRYINSVSDLLYSTDEIEFLLDDIRDLEPTSCRPEDIQDFEIAGSRTGALSAAADCAGGGCGECGGDDSPLGTVNSWDSHSHYRRRPASPDLSLYSGVIVYCDHTHLKTPTGLVRLLLVVTTIACLTCLCTSGTIKVGLFMLPLIGRLRLMMFVSLLSLFVTCALLFLDISHIIYLFPFNWGKVNAYFYISLSVLFLIASSLIFHTIFLSDTFSWVPKWTHHQLLVTGCLGYLCSFQSAILSLIQKCTIIGHYQPVAEDPSNLNLQERLISGSGSLGGSPDHNTIIRANQTTTITTMHNYKPLGYPLPSSSSSGQMVVVGGAASTSKHHQPSSAISNNSYMLDDNVQPCSSKSSDPYYNSYNNRVA